ncbi:MAG: [protein-PII] uridylyltransferase [Gammaproteobacteria bacterium]|nr:[protein-PII] uridylyltransferase [Gammaproteobacteria bacterium]
MTASSTPAPAHAQWFSLPGLEPASPTPERIQAYRAALEAGHKALKEQFAAGTDAAELVRALSWLVDQLLSRAWREQIDHRSELALVAVGGYGRSELLPGSDIDLLILLPDGAADGPYRDELQRFLAFLWDIGLEVGHSVRSPGECAEQARQDVTVMTNLVEARFLAGDPGLFETMGEVTAPDRLWTSQAFFAAKLAEQKARHAKFHDTAYKLEPNIKESPGGLRDIHMVGWVAKHHFGADRLEQLVDHGFLTPREFQALTQGQSFLWRVRFALHTLTGRHEDRLLFDYQRTLAHDLGYRDSDYQQAVELFMRDYFRNVQELNRLNEMLLQLFREVILHAGDTTEPHVINERFQSIKGFLEVRDDQVFRRDPCALLEVFLLLQQHPKLEGVRASTIRLIRAHTWLIDESFRQDPRARRLFMEIFRQPAGLTLVLRKMNRYGVLAAYIPVFARIVGQMQYDLFHVYTVDEHTLFLVRNLRRFTVERFAHEFPLCSEVIQTLPKPELLYLAGLFHDIAKGRGGDHSELGARDAYDFCILHELEEKDAELVAWLVRQHLLLSTTAQRQDISDPAVIHGFAEKIGDPVRLDYLYLLTVADIRATNPELWNSWKEALLQELFIQTRQALRRGLDEPVEQAEWILDTQEQAGELILEAGLDPADVAALWDTLEDDYFLRHSPDEIAWQAGVILGAPADQDTLVALRTLPQGGGTQLFLYTCLSSNLFSLTTALLDQLGLSIMDARIVTSRKQCALDTYVVMEREGAATQGPFRNEEIRTALLKRLRSGTTTPPPVTRRAPRQHQHFHIPTKIRFPDQEPGERTMVEVITSDRPGLLSRIGQAFNACKVSLENARVATFGARAEDVFYVVNEDGSVLDEGQQERLKATLLQYLE